MGEAIKFKKLKRAIEKTFGPRELEKVALVLLKSIKTLNLQKDNKWLVLGILFPENSGNPVVRLFRFVGYLKVIQLLMRS